MAFGREGGRNSATISFLNRVRNMSGHYLALAMQGADSGIMASSPSCKFGFVSRKC
jgi:hypothetical protein